MSADLVLGAIVLGATGLVALFAGADRGQTRRRARESFRAYATSRALRFEPASSGQVSPRILGTEDETTDLHRLGGVLRTRTSAATRHGRGLVLSVAQRGQFELGASAPVPVAALADDYVRTGGTPTDLDRLEVATAPLALLARRRREVWLVGDGATITLSWRGLERDPQILDAARAAVIALAAERGTPDPYR